MSCSNVYWFETFRLPGLGPRGGRGSSAAGGGLGLRCVVDDLGPVGAILMTQSHLCGYDRSIGLWEVLPPSKAAPEEHCRHQLKGIPKSKEPVRLPRASDSDDRQRNCSQQTRRVKRDSNGGVSEI